jgi:LEA14-like dessication related protein
LIAVVFICPVYNLSDVKFNLLNIAGLLGAFYLLSSFAGSAIAQKFSVGSLKVKFDKITLTSIYLTLYIPFINSSPVSIPIDNFLGKIKIGPYDLATVNLQNPVVLTAGETVNVKVPLQVKITDLANDVIQMITQPVYPSVFIEGKVTAKNIVIPISQNVQII